MLNGKARIALLTVGLIKSEYFLEPKSLEVRVKLELDFSNYAIKQV